METINQIAAGEVVERPASVIKELVENSLDAGATRVEVQLEQSGVRRIVIKDDGEGMSAEDALMSIQRHATSKIRSYNDLHEVASYGFRGEAIPSIASVSKMTIRTAVESGLRHVLVCDSGEVTSEGKDAGAKGTIIEVENLFEKVPARLKFLKSASAELAACTEVMEKYVLAFPEVKFVYSHNGKQIFESLGNGSLHDAVTLVWGKQVASRLLKVEFMSGDAMISGYVSPPDISRPTRARQVFYVNKRPMQSRMLQVSLEQVYKHLLQGRKFPLCVLNIQIDASVIDVNVSPTKTDVKFQHEKEVFYLVRQGVEQALLSSGHMHGIGGALKTGVVDDPFVSSSQVSTESSVPLMPSKRFSSSAGAYPHFSKDRSEVHSATLAFHEGVSSKKNQQESDICIDAEHKVSDESVSSTDKKDVTVTESTSRESHLEEEGPFATLMREARVLGGIMNTFILAEHPRGLLMIDQHVAHERVLFEQLWKRHEGAALDKQPLLIPEPIHLDKVTSSIVNDYLSTLSEAGFDLEPFGGGSFIVRSYPSILVKHKPGKELSLLKEILQELVGLEGGRGWSGFESSVGFKGSHPVLDPILAMCSCKMAVKAGDVLSVPVMEKLLSSLGETKNPYMCPHGRPIVVLLEEDDILRKFKRK